MPSFMNVINNVKSKFTEKRDDFEDDFYDDEDETSESSNDQLTQVIEKVESRQVSQYENDIKNTTGETKRSHSHGLDSLFTSTEENNVKREIADTAADNLVQTQRPHKFSKDIFESAHNTDLENREIGYVKPSRGDVTVARQAAIIQPDNYEEAEEVTKNLKKGNAVILDMRNTDRNLYKRFLDFSFGVASALGAKVDCKDRDMYIFTVGAPFSETEMARVRKEGLL